MSNGAIFDDFERTARPPASYGEAPFEYLNRFAGQYWGRQRDLIEAWFHRLCEDAKPHVRARLQSKDERQFRAAFWELYCHETLIRLGYNVVCEPELPETPRRPDFLVNPDAHPCVLEATVVGGSNAQIASDRREGEVWDVIDRIQTRNFYLNLETFSIGRDAPPARRLRKELEAWLEALDPDEVTDAIRRDGSVFGPSIPSRAWQEAGWHVVFRPLPIDPERRGQAGGRPIGVRGPGEARIVDDVSPLQAALRDKASAYGHLEMPFVVAIESDSNRLDDDDVMNALFGHQTAVVGLGPDGSRRVRNSREPDGILYGPEGPRSRRVSGVLIANRLPPLAVAQNAPTLWLNPWAEFPVGLPGLPWQVAVIVPHGALVKTDPPGRIHELFDLPSDWPGPETE